MYGLISGNTLIWADTLTACQEAAYSGPGAYSIVGEDGHVVEQGVIPQPVAARTAVYSDPEAWADIARTVGSSLAPRGTDRQYYAPMGADSTYRAAYARTGIVAAYESENGEGPLARTGFDGGDDGRGGPALDPEHHEERYSSIAEAIPFWEDWII